MWYFVSARIFEKVFEKVIILDFLLADTLNIKTTKYTYILLNVSLLYKSIYTNNFQCREQEYEMLDFVSFQSPGNQF